MKKIFESPLNGWESAERVHVYAFEKSEEFWEFSEMSHDERCALFNVFDESGTNVRPGAMYHTYVFDYSTLHVIMYEKIYYNI